MNSGVLRGMPGDYEKLRGRFWGLYKVVGNCGGMRGFAGSIEGTPRNYGGLRGTLGDCGECWKILKKLR